MEGLPNHMSETRPWGNFERFTLNEQSTVKLLAVSSGEEFSLQTHEHRDEFWRILSGNGSVIVGDETHDAKPGDSYFIPRHTKHRAMGGTETLHILEISLGEFDETDVVHLEDKYGRR